MKTLHQYLNDHLAEFVQKIYEKQGQKVDVVTTTNDNWLWVIDSPEYDMQWNRMCARVVITPGVGPMRGYIEAEFYTTTLKDDFRQTFDFNRDVAFGDALISLERVINSRIAD